jgi:hypothetical protein
MAKGGEEKTLDILRCDQPTKPKIKKKKTTTKEWVNT